MAIDLKAVLRLDDRLSNQLKNVDRAIERTNRSSSSLGRALNSASKQGSSGMGSVTSAIGKVSLALGGAVSAAKLFQSTIGEAMKFEQSSVLIEAMFDDKKLSNQYNAMIQKMAQDSPIMNTSDMMGSSKAFIGITKDLPALKQAWKVAEKLSIMDPEQGLQGAVYAMKELASGDGVSMAERFEMPKSVVNNLKKLSFEEQLVGIQKYLDKAGITNKTVDKMETTTIAKWNRVKERMGSVFRNMGTNGNTGINKALDGLLAKINSPQFDAFAKTMNVKIGGAITYATDKAIKMANFIQTHWGAISTTVKIVGASFIALKAVGFLVGLFRTISTVVGVAVKVFKVARTVFSLLRLAALAFPGSWLVLAIGAVIAAGVLLYKNWDKVKTVWASVWKSIKQNAADSVNSVISKINTLIGTINKIPGVNIPIIPKVNWGASEVAPAKKISKSNPQLGSMVNYAPKNYGGLNLSGNGHKGGISRVPYDGYHIRAHEGERVLTKEQNDTYNAGNGGVQVSFAGATFNVRQDGDAETIAKAIANEIFSRRKVVG